MAAGANNRRRRDHLAVRTPRGAAGPQPANASFLSPDGGAEPVPTGDAGGGGPPPPRRVRGHDRRHLDLRGGTLADVGGRGRWCAGCLFGRLFLRGRASAARSPCACSWAGVDLLLHSGHAVAL